jgi:hypothetical protein
MDMDNISVYLSCTNYSQKGMYKSFKIFGLDAGHIHQFYPFVRTSHTMFIQISFPSGNNYLMPAFCQAWVQLLAMGFHTALDTWYPARAGHKNFHVFIFSID